MHLAALTPLRDIVPDDYPHTQLDTDRKFRRNNCVGLVGLSPVDLD
jgi:hypothetical protein